MNFRTAIKNNNINLIEKNLINGKWKVDEYDDDLDPTIDIFFCDEDDFIDQEWEYDSIDYKPLHYCLLYKSDLNCLQVLLNYGSNINIIDAKKQTPLHLSMHIIDKNKHYLKFLLENNADVNAFDIHGNTALHYALIDNIHPKFIKLLIEYGANVNSKNNFLSTPLHEGIRYECSPELLQLLINNGADINAEDINGDNLLHICIYGSEFNSDYIDILLNNDININAVNKKGDTSLHEAVKCKHVHYIEKLLKWKADLSIKNNENQTFYDVADDEMKMLIDSKFFFQKTKKLWNLWSLE